MPTNDDTPTIDEILLTFAIRVETMPRGKTYDLENERAAIQNLIDRARLDELTSIEFSHARDEHDKSLFYTDSKEYNDRIKTLEAKIKEGE